MMHGQQNFLHAGHACRRGGVSDVALDGAKGTEIFSSGLFVEYCRKSLQFNWISQFRARSMGLYITDSFRINLVFGINAALQLDLTVDAGRSNSIGSAILVDSRP